MRQIEEIYDARYVHDTAETRGEDAEDANQDASAMAGAAAKERFSNMFPVFVVRRAGRLAGRLRSRHAPSPGCAYPSPPPPPSHPTGG